MKFKKVASLFLSILMILSVTGPTSALTASAASYANQLENKGFPKSYIPYLVSLHSKYPNWTFEPFKTNINWSTAVAGERSYHSKQLIETSAKDSFKCKCSSCYKNGKYVIQESSNWVSASEEAVEYYMDPRNFLDVKHIFQFEDTSYNSSQTKSGVESIIANTWMHNAKVTYLNTSGKKTTIANGESYSTCIMNSAKASGMSAYYLASKIVQEVGGSSPTAGGAKGNASPYNGIYNYYNIGAYDGATAGLRWAMGYMQTSASTKLYKTASTSAASLVTIPKGNNTYWLSNSGNFYRVKTTVNSKSYTGYVPKSKISMSTSYGRPWYTPSRSIYYGAKWIYNSFSKYQNTGYLQKFNVNSASGELYNHEYMANVSAAATESVTTYNAYNNAGILTSAKTFSIPVFKNMPNDNLNEITPTISVSGYGKAYITLKMPTLNLANGFYIYKYNPSTKKYVKIGSTTGSTYKDSNLKRGTNYTYKIRAYGSYNSKTIYSKYSSALAASTCPYEVISLSKTAVTNSTVSLKWNKVANCQGYNIYQYNNYSKSYKYIKTVAGNTSLSYKVSGLNSGATYKYIVRTYRKAGSKAYLGPNSPVLTIKTTGKATTNYTPATVTADDVNVRKGAGTSYAVITRVNKSQKVYIYGTSGDWYHIKFTKDSKTYYGYISKSYVKV